jgi:hypothetical protein
MVPKGCLNTWEVIVIPGWEGTCLVSHHLWDSLCLPSEK